MDNEKYTQTNNTSELFIARTASILCFPIATENVQSVI